jgi:tetratricopeptide (TPR) repeat protein
MRASIRLRARQWSRASWALAALFASLPLSCRLLLGEWGFESAGGVAALFLVAGIYLHILARRAARALPDPAEMLDRALEMARLGQMEEALAILTEAIRLSPWLWQAYQYRGELRLLQQLPDRAAEDFKEAIRLAPNEPHLRELLEQAQSPKRFDCSLE